MDSNQMPTAAGGGDSRRRSSSAAADAPELDAQDGHLGGQKRNARAHRPERTVQQQVERHAHRVRRDARHCHLPLAAQRGQDAHRHNKVRWRETLLNRTLPAGFKGTFQPIRLDNAQPTFT